jgi:hypothetical protein
MIKAIRRHRGADDAIYRLLLRTFFSLQDHCSPSPPSPQTAEDWNTVCSTLRENRLRPIAHWVARELRLDLPAGVKRHLEAAFFGAALRGEQIEGALAAIDRVLAAIRVQAILLKGWGLAKSLYPVPACRPMEDIDLLVRPPDLGRVGRALESIGYTDKTFGIEDFRSPLTNVDVDLHTECLNANRVPARRLAWTPDPERLWRRSRPFRAFSSILTLDPADQLVYLCQHAWLHHGLCAPLGLLDIALLFRRLSPDERWVGALDPQARRALWYALGACHSRIAPVLSESLERALRPAGASPVERLIHRLAIRGRLPESARYAYLWFAIPPGARREYAQQMLPAGWRMAAQDRGIQMRSAQSNRLTDL